MNIKKYPYSKQFLKAALAAALVIAPVAGTATVFQPEQASAAVKDTTGHLKVEVKDDDKTTAVSDVTVTIISKDAPGNLENPKKVTGKTSADGTYTTTTELEAGTYYVTLQKGDDKISQTTEVKVAGGVNKTTTAKFIYEDGSKPELKKTGAVFGVVYSSEKATADTIDVETMVTLVSKKTTYAVPTKNGIFKAFVPSGTYDVVVNGIDGDTDDTKNTIYEKIKVSAGQAASTLDQLNAKKAWAKDENKLGFAPKADDLKPESKSYTGAVAIGKGIVSVYDITTSDVATVDAAKLVATATVKPTDKKDLTKGGTYALKLKTAQPGRTLVFQVVDAAGNVYFETKTLDKYDTKLTAAPVEKAPLGGNVALSFTDLTKAYASSITSVKIKAATGDVAEIEVPKYDKATKKGYSVSGTKLTISSDNFKYVGDYTVVVKATGFVEQSVTQKIGPAKANAAALTASAGPGTTGDTTTVTVAASTADNTIVVQVSNLTIAVPKLGAALPAGKVNDDKTFFTNYTARANKDIPFVLGTVTKGYLGVYEVNSQNQIVAFKLLTVTKDQIKAK